MTLLKEPDRHDGIAILGTRARIELAHSPTPLVRLNRLSDRLGGPDIWIKRDDCTGLAGGGNKARKLEYLMAAALEANADTIISAGAIQSNHVRQVAAASAYLGLRCIVVLTDTVRGRGEAYFKNGNYLLDQILGAEIHLVSAETDSSREMEAIAERVRSDGGRPSVIPIGGSNPIGTLGYVRGFFELQAQLDECRMSADWIVLPTGSGGTQAGLLVGAMLRNWNGEIIGVSVGAEHARQYEKVRDLIASTAALVEADFAVFDKSKVLVDDGFVGAGYGEPDGRTLEAIELLARTEGILLDPVYSGKAMAGLIEAVRSDRFGSGQNVIFLHTGGSQALGAYPEYFSQTG